MLVDDVILLVLLSWVIPLGLFVGYQTTTPVPGSRWRRRFVHPRNLLPITRILVSQKLALMLVVVFIATVRFVGDFPGREWVALGLYTLLVALAWVVFIYQRRLQLPQERKVRRARLSKGDLT
jgi:hypothetical protein